MLSSATMPMDESAEHADLFRARFAQANNQEFHLRSWLEEAKRVKFPAVADCKSPVDHLNKQGSSPPHDKRLASDMQIRRNLMNDGMKTRWVATCQMIAEALTKQSIGTYLSNVLRTGMMHFITHPGIHCVDEEWALNE